MIPVVEPPNTVWRIYDMISGDVALQEHGRATSRDLEGLNRMRRPPTGRFPEVSRDANTNHAHKPREEANKLRCHVLSLFWNAPYKGPGKPTKHTHARCLIVRGDMHSWARFRWQPMGSMSIPYLWTRRPRPQPSQDPLKGLGPPLDRGIPTFVAP